MDEADLAEPIIQMERDASIDRVVHRVIETPFIIQGVRVCLTCYDPIPPKRLRAEPDAVRCHCCQQAHELISKRTK